MFQNESKSNMIQHRDIDSDAYSDFDKRVGSPAAK